MKDTKKALIWIVGILDSKKIKFRIAGGLAANIYGSKRELADIDIDISDDRFDELLANVKDKIIFGPKRYKDENWDLFMATLEYEEQDIDICAAGSEIIFNQNSKQWEKLSIDLTDTVKKLYMGVSLSVIKLKDLINYKSKILREVDKEDIIALA